MHLDFGISTSHYPAPVSQVIGQTLPYSIFLVGVAFFLSFLIGTAIGMFAAWRRGGFVDNVFVPTFMVLGAFPAFFTALLGLYFLGLQLHWFPIQHAYDSGLTPGSTGRSSRARSVTRSCQCSSSSPRSRAAGC